MNYIAPQYHENPSQRTPCMLVLDVSGSMGRKAPGANKSGIEELNAGLEKLRDELRKDETAALRVQIAVVTVGGPKDDAALLMDWTDAADFVAPPLRVGGRTPLAQGMRLALHHVEQQKQTLRQHGIAYTRPWIMVISDGEPTDPQEDWDSVVQDCLQSERAKRCVIFPIGVEGANVETMQKLSSTRAASLSTAKFDAYFQWLSASLSSVSQSAPGDSIALPATDPWAVFKP